MDVGRGLKFRASSYSLLLIIPLCVLLGASAAWNLWQHNLLEQQQRQSSAAAPLTREEATRADMEAKPDQAQLKRKAVSAEDKARVDQLYKELENLGRLNEQLLLQTNGPRSTNRDEGKQIQTSGGR
jgi:hypothetical protein